MAFRLPQAPNPNDRIRRFVATAMQARAQDQNENFQIQRELINMEAQQKRKELLGNAFQTSIARIKQAYTQPSDLYNREVENEAMQYETSAPEIATALRRNKREEPKIQSRQLIDAQGRKVERLEKYDPFLSTSTPIPGTERVIDENLKVVTADTEADGTVQKKAITLNPKGAKVGEQVIGSESVAPADAKTGEAGYYKDSRTKGYAEKKDKASQRALEIGMTKINLENAIKAFDAGEKEVLFNFDSGDGKQITKKEDAVALRAKLDEQIAQAKKEEGEWQQKIDGLKRTYGVGGTTPPKPNGPFGKVRYYDSTTGTLKDSLDTMK